jgi:hypothetical protein
MLMRASPQPMTLHLISIEYFKDLWEPCLSILEADSISQVRVMVGITGLFSTSILKLRMR